MVLAWHRDITRNNVDLPMSLLPIGTASNESLIEPPLTQMHWKCRRQYSSHLYLALIYSHCAMGQLAIRCYPNTVVWRGYILNKGSITSSNLAKRTHPKHTNFGLLVLIWKITLLAEYFSRTCGCEILIEMLGTWRLNCLIIFCNEHAMSFNGFEHHYRSRR